MTSSKMRRRARVAAFLHGNSQRTGHQDRQLNSREPGNRLTQHQASRHHDDKYHHEENEANGSEPPLQQTPHLIVEPSRGTTDHTFVRREEAAPRARSAAAVGELIDGALICRGAVDARSGPGLQLSLRRHAVVRGAARRIAVLGAQLVARREVSAHAWKPREPHLEARPDDQGADLGRLILSISTAVRGIRSDILLSIFSTICEKLRWENR